MKARILLSTFFIAMVFCGSPLNAQKTAEEKKLDQIFQPDSLLSAEQIALKYKIGRLLIDKVSINKDGLFESTVKEKDFTDNEIPLYYYRMLQKNIAEGNRMVKEDRISKEQMEKYLEDAKKTVVKDAVESKGVIQRLGDDAAQATREAIDVAKADSLGSRLGNLGTAKDSLTNPIRFGANYVDAK